MNEKKTDIRQDNTLTDIEKKVLQVITLYNRPVTVREIADELAINITLAERSFFALLAKGNIIAYSSHKGSKYYTVANSREGIDVALSQKYVDLIEPLEKKYEEIKAEQEKLNEQLNGVYVQIITLMGIFVAIFALIIINVSAIGEFANTITNPLELCKTLAILNIPLVVSLLVLVALIKWLIKPPRKKKK